MGSIKPLPDAVRSSVRSATILFDLTRVVEELIFNSLDAAASKVSVFLSVGSSYVKVVDDGSGISRDGLVLLGERYVTSKLNHLSDLDAASSSFGFRGEALASVSDVALVEIVTKAYGRPNGYRKVIKGSKCLYLGIDDDRKDTGTTDQSVCLTFSKLLVFSLKRADVILALKLYIRKVTASPKKVLHSVKKCVFRIALVHPMVYFNLIDIESEDELLSVHPSSSPLPLLMSGLGIEDCACLQKLNASDGSLKLSGYISGPCDDFTSKAFQYVYINSRLVCKGPIHKLLNNMATSFESLHPEKKANNWTKNGKRSRSQVVPSYIINISCPPSFYDLTFEPSKTYVEFKDWRPVCTLIETAVQHLWRKNISYADGLGQAETLKEDANILNVAEDFFDGSSVDLEFATRKRTKKYQPSSSLDKLTIDNLFLMDHEDTPFEECNGNTAQFKDQQNDMKFVHWTDYSFQSLGDFLSKGGSIVNQRSDWHLWSSDNNILEEDHFLENRFIASGRPNYHVNDNNISSKLGNESLKFESCVTNETVRSVFPFDSHELCNDLQFRKNISKPFMQSCSFQRNRPLDRELVESDTSEESTSNEVHGPYTFLETGYKKPPQLSSGLHNGCFEPNFGKNRSNMSNKPDKVQSPIVQKCDKIEQPYCREDPELVPVQGSPNFWNQMEKNSWRNNKLYDADNEDTLLDIASGFLNLVAGSFVPKSISKKCLTEAKVLQQVDKKFIPIVADGTLAIIDQHAADERIQLEELRRKVLSGEGKSVAYLDTEKELILPEMGYHLLHNYSEQIRHWGWICDFHPQDSRSFKKNLNLIHRKPAVVILLAVPCILGVNLSDVDLLEFLHQLADTDGSSTMPPSVSRILNSKACRGAIMFGDSLLPSECSLIVEELKQTSLCFQCAHGRPTTAPLVNLEALHGQIAKMQVRDDEGRELWHGLCRQGVSLERASLRLRAAADEIPN
ncbi:hypothetical protein GOBAR_DD22355 [Gossypium barbadense]|nr:hypothetical protein GOBAR_DD22355 [Gossypium barbadense]